MKIGVCTCVRDERPYLREWIAHYRRLQFDHVWVYDNQSGDASRDLLDRLAGPDLEVLPWNTIPKASPQLTAFEHAARAAVGKCDFLAFFDVDEFLMECTEGALHRALSNLDAAAEGIVINQRIVGSNGQRKFSPLPVVARFPLATSEAYLENVWVKSIVRPESVVKFSNPHVPATKSRSLFSSAGVPLAEGALDSAGKLSVVDHRYLALNHYILKSYEEFLWKRHRGGGAAANLADRLSRYESDSFFTNRQVAIDKCLTASGDGALSPEQEQNAMALAIEDLRLVPARWTVRAPLLSPAQRDWLILEIAAAATFVSYGVTEAIIDAVYAGVPRVVVVDSSVDLLQRLGGDPLVAAAKSAGRLDVMHADIGLVDDYGYPVNTPAGTPMPAYPESAWRSVPAGVDEERPLVLVTGRYRVACACHSALRSPDCKIMLRDFAEREQYQVLERLFDVSRVIDGAAVLELRGGIGRHALVAAYNEHLVDCL